MNPTNPHGPKSLGTIKDMLHQEMYDWLVGQLSKIQNANTLEDAVAQAKQLHERAARCIHYDDGTVVCLPPIRRAPIGSIPKNSQHVLSISSFDIWGPEASFVIEHAP